jgi:two-component system chemotaxis response regulator CheB
LGIVTSTGGPNALVQVLGGLGADFPLPILLVQHITGSFLAGFASWLNAVSPFTVVVVKDRARTLPGNIYMAEQDHHLVASDGVVRACGGVPVCAQRPSGTVLFDSMAAAGGSRALGLLLTGMGEDGAQGLLRLRQSGAWTIAEDESTAVVYGMPAEAVRLGAVSELLPLPAIGARLLGLALQGSAVAR